MKKLGGNRGEISVLELILIPLIVFFAVFFLIQGGDWMKIRVNHGNDGLTANTAESVARINSNNGLNCPVDGSSGRCPHWTSSGYIAYYDNVGNTIVGEKPYGYNEDSTMVIDGKKYYGDPGTMVIKVVCSEGKITLSWEEGRQ